MRNARLGRHRHGMTILCYFRLISCPLFASSLLRRSESRIVYCFVFRVRHIYCGMTSCLPCASVRLGCPRHVSFPWFSRTRSPIHFVLFPPFLFVFVQFSSSFVVFISFGVFFLPDLSSFPLFFSGKFLVLPSFLLFF